MKVFRTYLIVAALSMVCVPGQAQDNTYPAWQHPSGPQIESVTLEGGPIATKHFQGGDETFNERHGIAIAKIHTRDYGNWALLFLNPNSQDDTSFGAGYATDPWVIPLGATELELSAALGLITGYQDYPLPLIAGQARLKLYESGNWNAGLTMAANPYIMEDRNTSDTEWGIVATTPFLSVRYKFQ